MRRPTADFRRLLAVRILLLAVAFGLSGLALSVAAPPARADIIEAHDLVMAGDALRTRIVMQLDGEASLHWFLLRAPHRLVVDLPRTGFAIVPDELKPRGLVTNVRYGKISEDHSRMIFAVNGPFTVDGISVVKNESSPGYRFVADVVAAPEAAFEAALAKQAGTAPHAAAAADEPVKTGPEAPGKPFTIVIDPGHHHHKPWPPVIVDPVHPKPIHPPIVTGTFPIDPVSDPGIKPVHGFPVGGIKPIKGYPVSSGGSNNNSCFADPAKCLNLHPKFQH